MTRTASLGKKRFAVFEFSEEDERESKEAERFLGIFREPKRSCKSNSPLDKYNFLQCFTHGYKTERKVTNNEPIDLDTEAMGHHQFMRGSEIEEKKISNGPIVLDFEDIDPHGAMSQKQELNDEQIVVDVEDDAAFQKETSSVDLLSSSSTFEHKQVSIISDDDDGDEMSSSVAFTCPPAETQSKEHVSAQSGANTGAMKVVISPDFILHGEIYSTKAELTFFTSSLKVEVSTVNGIERTFSFEWSINDIISIESEWCGRVETAFISLVLKSNDSKTAGGHETSGIKLLKFSVYDPCWSKRQEAIKLLNLRYKDIWKVVFDINVESKENVLLGQNGKCSSKSYISDFHEPFQDVIYPKGDPDAVSISKRDFELLQPETFINDTIVDFYIKYMKNRLQPEEQHRFHFFNSFFFRKLADLDKVPSSACEARAAFQRVRKWTRKVDIFEKDYIFIPVNYSFHWSLIVICHPGEVANFKDDEIEKLPRLPCILHMDSIAGSHRGLRNIFQSYLCEEWKERHSDAADDIPSRFLRLQFFPLELPQQENSFDCGLFLLHFVELFLQEAPHNFNPFKIIKCSNFLNTNWFPPAEASLKRSHIQKLIYEILEDESHNAPSADNIDGCASSKLPFQTDQENGVEFVGELCSSAKSCRDNSPNSESKQGIKILNRAAAPLTAVKHIRNSGLAFQGLVELGTCGKSFSNGDDGLIDALDRRKVMSPIEDVETSTENAADTSSDLDGQNVAGVSTESYIKTEYWMKDSRTPEISLNWHLSLYIEDSASEISSSGSEDSAENGLEEDRVLQGFEESNHLEKADKPELPLKSSEDLAEIVVEDSQESDDIHDGCASKHLPSLFHREIPTSTHKKACVRSGTR